MPSGLLLLLLLINILSQNGGSCSKIASKSAEKSCFQRTIAMSFGANNDFRSLIQSIARKKTSCTKFVRDFSQDFGAEGVLSLQKRLHNEEYYENRSQTDISMIQTQIIAVIKDVLDSLERESMLYLGPELCKHYLLSKPGLVVTADSSTGRRSLILDCIDRKHPDRCYKAKIFKDVDRFEREITNYKKIVGRYGSKDSEFLCTVMCGKSLVGNVVVQEAGQEDLRQFIDRTIREGNAALRIRYAKQFSKQLCNILSRFHKVGLVWSDMKAENVVLMREDGKSRQTELIEQFFSLDSSKVAKSAADARLRLKAIDLESAVRVGGALLDFSPDTCPPELALLLEEGEVQYLGEGKGYRLDLLTGFEADFKQDIWSLAMTMLFVSTGSDPLGSRTSDFRKSLTVLRNYREGTETLGLNKVDDVDLKRLLSKMMSVDPDNRPSINNIFFSKYYLFP